MVNGVQWSVVPAGNATKRYYGRDVEHLNRELNLSVQAVFGESKISISNTMTTNF